MKENRNVNYKARLWVDEKGKPYREVRTEE